MPITVNDILRHLDLLAPRALAEEWDNVGLLIGDSTAPVSRVLVALDASASVITQAEKIGAELLVVHHPLLFSSIKRLTEDGGVVSSALRLVRNGCSLIACHTNLDSAPFGLNHYVGELLGLQQMRPLLPTAAGKLLKLAVFVPQTHAEVVRAALCAAGAGHIGNYSDCTFSAPGEGTFRAGDNTHPFIGRTGELARVAEVRLETVLPRELLPAVMAALRATHPYEEIAYDLYPLENILPDAGLGRIGTLATPVSVAEFTAHVAKVLATDTLKVLGDPGKQVRTVALCTGAGGDFAVAAQAAGADLYLTGEVKHHTALLARDAGMAIIDAGHYPTERPMVPLVAKHLRQLPGIEVVKAAEEEPWVRSVGL